MERPSSWWGKRSASAPNRKQVLLGAHTDSLLIGRGPTRRARHRGRTSVVALWRLKRPPLGFKAVLVVAAAALFTRRAGAISRQGSMPGCIFSTALDELGAGDHVVSVEVSNTFHGVPAADANCPSGEHVWTGCWGRCYWACDARSPVLSFFCQICDELLLAPFWAVGCDFLCLLSLYRTFHHEK